MVVTDDEQLAEQVGRLEMAVACADESIKRSDRWDRRVDALTAWLVSEWRREHAEAN